MKSLNEHRKAFSDYVAAYDCSDPKIALKIRHTFRVCEIMNRLIQSLNLNGETAEDAWLCALYHDIGRFEQIRRYQTFVDAKSISHALLSCEVLNEEGFLNDLPEDRQRRILQAIAHHSDLSLPGFEDEKTLLLARLIRDADKLDIFRVYVEEDALAVSENALQEILSSSVSESVRKDLQAHCSIERSRRQSPLDNWAALIGFYYDLNFLPSLTMAEQEGWLKKLFEQAVFTDLDTREDILALLNEAQQYMEEKLKQS